MHHANKIWGAVALVSALLVFMLVLAGVVSTDSYSRAAQVQTHGDPLMQLSLSDADASGSDNAEAHDHTAVSQ